MSRCDAADCPAPAVASFTYPYATPAHPDGPHTLSLCARHLEVFRELAEQSRRTRAAAPPGYFPDQ